MRIIVNAQPLIVVSIDGPWDQPVKVDRLGRNVYPLIDPTLRAEANPAPWPKTRRTRRGVR